MTYHDDLLRQVAAIRWFHRIPIAEGIITPGLDDTQAKLKRLKLPEDLHGKSVLDIGAWDGFFSFEAERRGASRVLAVDSFCWNGAGWGRKTGFELAHRLLNSAVESQELEVLDLAPQNVGTFDMVLFLGVLYHMRHPLLALEKVASVTKSLLVLETAVDLFGGNTPAMVFFLGNDLNGDPTNWWAPNISGLCAMLLAVGFERIEIVSPPQRWHRRLWGALRNGRPFGKKFRQGRVVVHAWKPNCRF